MNRDTDPIHELLPWFAAGTLDGDESRAFERHLPACAPCREELAVLHSLREEIERHGPDFLADHPTAERLVAAVRGEAPDDETRSVRRHLGLCSTCALESRWIRGDAVAEGVAAPRPVLAVAPQRPWVWALVAAGLVFALMLPLTLRDGSSMGPAAVLDTLFVEPTVRGDGGIATYRVAPEATEILLMVEVDLPRDGFPATVEILDGAGTPVIRREGVSSGSLAGASIGVTCPRHACADGAYTAVVTPASGSAPIRTRFNLATRN